MITLSGPLLRHVVAMLSTVFYKLCHDGDGGGKGSQWFAQRFEEPALKSLFTVFTYGVNRDSQKVYE